jgi:glycine hydroxymethyltransferase
MTAPATHLSALAAVDPAIAAAIGREEARERNTLEMIASENFTSSAVMEAVGSVLTNKYAEGYPGNRYYGGCEVIGGSRRSPFSAPPASTAWNANVQPLRRRRTWASTWAAGRNTVMGLKLDQGGHLTHGSPVNASGILYKFVPYLVDRETEQVDYDQMLNVAKEARPKIIVVGATAYPRQWDFKRARQIADEVGAVLMADMAHISGLVAGGVHPSPAGVAQIMTTSTHKTLRGPRGGMILATTATAGDRPRRLPGARAARMHVVAGKAVAFHRRDRGVPPLRPRDRRERAGARRGAHGRRPARRQRRHR